MVMRWNLLDTLFFHFCIGIGLALTYAIRCRIRSYDRTLFRFGGTDALTMGDRSRWGRWYVLAYGFEFFTSFLVGKHLYLEMALSLFEAGALTIGLFIVDRIMLLWEEIKPMKGEEAK